MGYASTLRVAFAKTFLSGRTQVRLAASHAEPCGHEKRCPGQTEAPAIGEQPYFLPNKVTLAAVLLPVGLTPAQVWSAAHWLPLPQSIDCRLSIDCESVSAKHDSRSGADFIVKQKGAEQISMWVGLSLNS